MAIKVVIFDMGGVIVSEKDVPVLKQLSKLFDRDIDTIEFAVGKDIPDLQTGKIDNKTFFKHIVSELGTDVTMAEWRDVWYNGYSEHVKLNQPVVSMARKLRQAGYLTPIISNTEPGHVKINMARELYDGFEPLILSCEVGCRKPDAKIYKIALKKIGVDPDKCIFVDDNEEFLAPARKMGMETIHFQNARQLKKELIGLGLSFPGT